MRKFALAMLALLATVSLFAIVGCGQQAAETTTTTETMPPAEEHSDAMMDTTMAPMDTTMAH